MIPRGRLRLPIAAKAAEAAARRREQWRPMPPEDSRWMGDQIMRPAFLYGRCWRRPYWGASRTRTRPRMCRQSAAADAHDETSRVHATTIEPLADARWAALVDRSLEASPFHHPVWLELRSRTYGYAICA